MTLRDRQSNPRILNDSALWRTVLDKTCGNLNMVFRLALCFVALALTASMAHARTIYRDVTATHVPKAPDLHALSVVFVDVDKDGDLDVVLAVENGANRLYLNDGHGRLTWRPGAFGTEAHDSEHVLSADFNGDGFPDLIFVAEDDKAHQLFLGAPGGSFIDASQRLPVRSVGNALAVGDVNGDGLPDIVVGNSGDWRDRKRIAGSGQNFLWLNDPARPGTFIDATATHLPSYDDDTQDIALVDIDGDGHLDMIVANEVPPNRLLRNDGRGRFTEVSDRLDLRVPMETRQVHVFDATGDGKPDILFLNITSNTAGWKKDPQARLLVNDGRGFFVDETSRRMPPNTFSTYAGTIVDFNRDGFPDIILGPVRIPVFGPLRVRAYENDGKGGFRDVTRRVIPRKTDGRNWGMAVGDLDGDGIEDIFIGGWGTQARLLLGTRAPTSRR